MHHTVGVSPALPFQPNTFSSSVSLLVKHHFSPQVWLSSRVEAEAPGPLFPSLLRAQEERQGRMLHLGASLHGQTGLAGAVEWRWGEQLC